MLYTVEVLTDYPQSLIVGIDAGDKFAFSPDLDHVITSKGLSGYAKFDFHNCSPFFADFLFIISKCGVGVNHPFG